jgi:hypothetical protein
MYIYAYIRFRTRLVGALRQERMASLIEIKIYPYK